VVTDAGLEKITEILGDAVERATAEVSEKLR
jgi:hypothetical protein